jgi:hypothetical protein
MTALTLPARPGNGLPSISWAICALSAGYRVHDGAARNRSARNYFQVDVLSP